MVSLNRLIKQRKQRKDLRIAMGKPLPKKPYSTLYPDLLWKAYEKIMRELQ